MGKNRKKNKRWIKKQRNKEINPTLSASIPIQSQKHLLGANEAIIYKSELEFVSRCILDRPNIETGGQMFGYWTDNGTPVVLYTIGPGPRANHQTAFFNQDINYLESVGNILTQKYGLQHIGEWHSHHQLGLARPSGHDASSMANGLLSSGRERFLLCIGNCTSTTTSLNPFNFVSGEGVRYVDAQWVIKHVDSPFRAIIDAELRNALFMPNAKRPNYEGMCNVSEPQVENPIRKPQYDSEYWLSDKKNNLVLKSMMDFLNSDPSVANLKTMLDDNKQVHLTLFWRRRFPSIISFPAGFPNVPPKFKVYLKDWTGTNATECSLMLPDWNYNGDILSAFVEYYDKITIN